MTGEYKIENSERLIFLLDSGASDHLINSDKEFSSVIELNPPMKISVAKNGEFITATKKGKIHVMSNTGIQGILEDVLYCPDVPYNLISVQKMQQAGMSITFNEKGVKVYKDGKILMYGKPSNNLFAVDFEVTKKGKF